MAFFCLLASIGAQSQKYPSLLWEITGNGLQKPSYLFGTMHVSSKMAFHLSDSFYIAIRNVDMVALEQNPLNWQSDMVKAEQSGKAIREYQHNGANNFINEHSFALSGYEDRLKLGLTEQPMAVNGLLYRRDSEQEDFEENTYLDLYIFQTGRKLGKQATGVENYSETERLVYEAYSDAYDEKVRMGRSSGRQPAPDIQAKIQMAYRQGNLDMLDSLEKYEFGSPAFIEKFLYRRNEIQANSIDTILQKHSLFAGVGAAHLAGERGVIELLRRKGYLLRPMTIQEKMPGLQEQIDKLKVPVIFQSTGTPDGFVNVEAPGPLYRQNNEGDRNESWHFADMENGAYYSVVRVKTYAAMLGQNLRTVLRKTDSLLYENIPGKILKKTFGSKSGYSAIFVTNRTRRGDIQRYQMIITPFETVVCKISGTGNYVLGKEADHFFNSLKIKHALPAPTIYSSLEAGFSASFPAVPFSSVNQNTTDHIDRYEFQCADSTAGVAYMVWKKTVNNYRFLEKDSFDLSLVQESMKRSDVIAEEVKRHASQQGDYPALRIDYRLKSGVYLHTKAILRSAHYYLLTVTSSKLDDAKAEQFFQSFQFLSFPEVKGKLYTDSSMHFTVSTSVIPVLDTFLLRMAAQSVGVRSYFAGSGSSRYRNVNKTAFFKNHETGEAVLVTCTEFPKYFYRNDSASFWKTELNLKQYKDKLVIKSVEKIRLNDSCAGYQLVLADTGTLRQIRTRYLLQKDRLYQLTALEDTKDTTNSFVRSFFNSFLPWSAEDAPGVFSNKQNLFFADYESRDSARHALAVDAIDDMPFDCDALPRIETAINNLQYDELGYMDIKSRLIHELGFMKNCNTNAEKLLAELSTNTSDTAKFANEIAMSMARLRTQSSYKTLLARLADDPPVFDSENEYTSFFELISDSLSLARCLLPQLLQLTPIESYYPHVNTLLQTLIDSNSITTKDYDSYYTRLLFSAKIEIKKMQIQDERIQEKEKSNSAHVYRFNYSYIEPNSSTDNLATLSGLLLPFYKTKPAVQHLFERQLASKNGDVQMEAAILLAKQNLHVPDSIWTSLASKDKYRATLLKKLQSINRQDLFPKEYNNQESLAVSVLIKDSGQEEFYQCTLLGKQVVETQAEKGYVYFFKYKIYPADKWKIGISGLQPLNSSLTSSNDDLSKMTDEQLLDNESALEQCEDQLQRLLFALHDSAGSFFQSRQYYSFGQ